MGCATHHRRKVCDVSRRKQPRARMYNPGYGQPSQAQPQQSAYYQQQQPGLDFYTAESYAYGGRPSLEGTVGMGGAVGVTSPGFGGSVQSVGPWWSAFGPGGFEGEPPLLEGAFSNCHAGTTHLTPGAY